MKTSLEIKKNYSFQFLILTLESKYPLRKKDTLIFNINISFKNMHLEKSNIVVL